MGYDPFAKPFVEAPLRTYNVLMNSVRRGAGCLALHDITFRRTAMDIYPAKKLMLPGLGRRLAGAHGYASSSAAATKSPVLHSVLVTPAAIAGVTRRVWCLRTKLYEPKWSAVAAAWFSIFLLKALVSRV